MFCFGFFDLLDDSYSFVSNSTVLLRALHFDMSNSSKRSY